MSAAKEVKNFFAIQADIDTTIALSDQELQHKRAFLDIEGAFITKDEIDEKERYLRVKVSRSVLGGQNWNLSRLYLGSMNSLVVLYHSESSNYSGVQPANIILLQADRQLEIERVTGFYEKNKQIIVSKSMAIQKEEAPFQDISEPLSKRTKIPQEDLLKNARIFGDIIQTKRVNVKETVSLESLQSLQSLKQSEIGFYFFDGDEVKSVSQEQIDSRQAPMGNHKQIAFYPSYFYYKSHLKYNVWIKPISQSGKSVHCMVFFKGER